MKHYNTYFDNNGNEISAMKWYLSNPKELIRVITLGTLYTVAGVLTTVTIASIVAMIINCF